MNQKRKATTYPDGSRKNSKNKRNKQSDGLAVTVPSNFKSLSLVFPPRMNIRLKFFNIESLSLAASNGANYRYRPTAAFDEDPALGGTAMAGFAEMAAIWSSYRVVASTIKTTMDNPSATVPVTLIVLPMNADPTNAFSVANIVASTGNPYARMKVSSLVGGPPSVVSNSMTTAKIFGDPAIYFDHNFSSLATTVPTNNWFWNVCIYAPAFIAAAIYITTEITVDVEFFDRIFLPA